MDADDLMKKRCNMNIVENAVPKYIAKTPLGISIYTAADEPTHYHKDALELIYCLKGSVSVLSSYEVIPLATGEILCINCNEVHGIDGRGDNLIVSFYLDFSHPFFQGQNLGNFMFKLTPDLSGPHQKTHLKELHDLILSALYIFTGDYEPQTKTFQAIADQMTQILIQYFSVYCIADYDVDIAWSKERFDRMLLYLNTHYREKLTLKSMSSIEHLNPNYLSVYFNKIFDDTFNNYLALLRVFHSEIDLLATSDTISTISYNCGFSDPKFYYKTFKQWYGTTPANHRKWHKKHNKKSRANRFYHVNEIRHIIQQYILYYFSKAQLAAHQIPMPSINLSGMSHKTYAEWRSY